MNDLLFLFPVAVGAFASGTIFGAIVLRPRVGPWYGRGHGRPASDPRGVTLTPGVAVQVTPAAPPALPGWVLVDPKQESLPAVGEPARQVIYVLPGESLQALPPISGEETQ